MMRLVILLSALTLTACSSGGEVPLYRTVWEQFKAQRAKADAPKAVKRTPPRSEIERLNLAMVQMNLQGEDIWPVMTPTVKNGPFVTYGNKFRQLLTLNESQITATRGFGRDLISADSPANDPLKRLTPPDAWPTNMTRAYRLTGSGAEGGVTTYECVVQRAGPAQISIAGTAFDVVGFAETCEGSTGRFTNLYAADAKTGRVWQSRQFVGPDAPAINLDILEPLTP